MADVLGRILIKAPQRMNHGSVAGVLSFGGKIPANSNSVFTSRQSPFRAAGESAHGFLQFALFGGGRKGRGRDIGSGRGLSCGRGRSRLRLRKRCHYTGFFRGRGRPRYVSLFGGQGHGERGRSPHIELFFK